MKKPFEIGAVLGAWLGCGVFALWAWQDPATWNAILRDGMSFLLAAPVMAVGGLLGGALGWIAGRLWRR